MTNVTVLFLDETFPSTAIGPMEVFRHTGTRWNCFTGMKPVCHFHVTTNLVAAESAPPDTSSAACGVSLSEYRKSSGR